MGKTSSGEPVDVQNLIKLMDKFDIEKVLISSLSGVVTKEQNDLVKHCIDLYPERILGLAFINPKAPDVVEEMHRCLQDERMVGIKLHPWKHGYKADNTSQLDTVFSIAEQYGVHIQAHVGTSPLTTPFPWIRYAKKYPNVRLLFTHMGCREFAYSAMKAIENIDNIVVETSVIYDRDVLENIKYYVGAERILFGTDWPYKTVDVEVEKVKKMGLNPEELKLVYRENALKLIERRTSR